MKPRIKILVLSHSAVVDAYREKWRILARRRGWELHLVMPASWPEGGKPLAAPTRDKEGALWLHVLPCRFSGRVGYAMLDGLAELALSLRPQLIYAEEEPYSFNAFFAFKAARRLDIPFVFYTWENMDRRYKPPLNWVRGRVLAGASAGVVGNSEGKGLLRSWGFEKSLLLQPQYGVDLERFRPSNKKTRVSRGQRPFTLGYFGRLAPEKGVDLLIEAAARTNLRLRIGGQGPQGAALKALGIARGVEVRFDGFVPFERRESFYADIDVLVLPSRTTRSWKEQFGRVLAEAMACGLPCVGSNSGAIGEVMGPAGLVFREGDAADLAQKIGRLASEKSLWKRLGLLGRSRAVKYYDEKVLAAELGDFFEAVIDAKR